MAVLSINKPLGVTPLSMIERVKYHYPQFRHSKIAYAGRLDPMAEGLLLLLTDEDCKKRTLFERLSKEYQATIALGIESDTYDTLGIVTNSNVSNTLLSRAQLQEYISSFVGEHIQPYPPYSSARVNGKPLFYWARHNLLHTLSIPNKAINIFDIQLHGLTTVLFSNLYPQILERILKVRGDFRQTDILKSWKLYSLKQDHSIQLADITITCSSGTYIRSLAHELGKKVMVGGLLYALKRTKIGEYDLHNALLLDNIPSIKEEHL